MTGRRPPSRQRGAALLTAMIIVTLIVTLAASMVWQQWRAVQVETAERARVQSAWILNGALDWARLILREDARSGKATALNEPWATPLAEARLSTFLAIDKDNADDAPEAFLSGSIEDAQARLNLTNLVQGGQLVPAEVAALDRLCQAVGVSSDVGARIAQGLRAAESQPGTAGTDAPLRPRTVAQLAWLGIDVESIARLRPYLVILPATTRVNVNTAAREVIAAAVENLDLATAERLVRSRPFKSVADVEKQVPGLPGLGARLDVKSSYFEVRGRLRLEDRVLEQQSLIQRRGLDIVVLRREQVSMQESPGN
jgi:general secretion pathway protein K